MKRLKNEEDAPDLWATIGQEKVLMAAVSSPNLNNSPFTQNRTEVRRHKIRRDQTIPDSRTAVRRIRIGVHRARVRLTPGGGNSNGPEGLVEHSFGWSDGFGFHSGSST